MGWGNCGTDSEGRPIGYVFEAQCDHSTCTEVIDRGLGYVCGDMHGFDEYSCDRYFCSKHRADFVIDGGTTATVCAGCAAALIETGEWEENEDEGAIVRANCGT